MNTNKFPDLTGLIFERAGQNKHVSYWKITGPARPSCGGYAYPVIKCSKLGKEYKEINGFATTYVLNLKDRGALYHATKEGKASTEGIKSGIRKRRIDFLITSMRSMVEELNGLLEEEARGEVFELIVK